MERDDEVWAVFPNEPAWAFEAFAIFRDLGEARTLTEAYRQFAARRQERGRAPGEGPTCDYVSFCAMGLDWGWRERAAAFDRYQARARRRQESAERQEDACRRRQRMADLESRMHELEMVIAREIHAALEGGFESTTRQSSQGGAVTREVDDKLRRFHQLCQAEALLARLSADLSRAGAAPGARRRDG